MHGQVALRNSSIAAWGYVYNINRDRVFMANKDQYKDRGAAEVFITGLYSP